MTGLVPSALTATQTAVVASRRARTRCYFYFPGRLLLHATWANVGVERADASPAAAEGLKESGDKIEGSQRQCGEGVSCFSTACFGVMSSWTRFTSKRSSRPRQTVILGPLLSTFNFIELLKGNVNLSALGLHFFELPFSRHAGLCRKELPRGLVAGCKVRHCSQGLNVAERQGWN